MPQTKSSWSPRPRELAPWAVDAARSQGRLHDEPVCPMRTPFQRDRDRIVHATAFRRLNYKTQVFLLHEGDHYRSRLTHSLEVAQIARSIARQLGLDEDLAEALALAHDLGHPPFGHAGERALHRAMEAIGGFDHNAQSLRVVTRLERKYWSWDGLNLTFETLEGLVKHNGPVRAVQQPLLAEAVTDAGLAGQIWDGLQAPCEAQVAAIADDIAYNNHDIDDALRAGLVSFDELATVPLAGNFVREVAISAGDVGDPRRTFYAVNRRMITAMIADVLASTRARLASIQAYSVKDIRNAPGQVVRFSEHTEGELQGLKQYLFGHVYRHERLMRAMRGAEAIVSDLFARYLGDVGSLPAGRGQSLNPNDEAGRIRTIGDFIAGMTDRFAEAEHRRLFSSTPELR